MVLPATTPTGPGVFVTDKSAELVTKLVTVTLLLLRFGSAVVELTVSVWVMDPGAVVEFTVTTKVKAVVVVPEVKFPPSVQVRAARGVQVHPAGPVSETAVVPAGSVSTSFGVVAVAGPRLVTVWV